MYVQALIGFAVVIFFFDYKKNTPFIDIDPVIDTSSNSKQNLFTGNVLKNLEYTAH